MDKTASCLQTYQTKLARTSTWMMLRVYLSAISLLDHEGHLRS